MPNTETLLRRVMEHVKDISGKWTRRARSCDGGMYVGLTGLAYTLHRLSCVPQLAHERDRLLESAKEMLPVMNYYISRHRVDVNAFIIGNPGTFAANAVIQKELGNMEECQANLDKFAAIAEKLLPVDFLDCGGDEYLVGRAGYYAGILYLRRYFDKKFIEEEPLFTMLDASVEAGQKYSAEHKCSVPLMYHYYETQYLGAVHGASSVFTMMLCFPEWLAKRPEAKELLRKSVDALTDLQQPNGNFPASMDEVGVSRSKILDYKGRPKDELVHWCHGAPGFVHMLGKAYLVFGDQKFLDAALKCGEITWEKGLLTKGPGICHGIAGSGYVFLTLYRLTKDKKHLHRAVQFYHFLYSEAFKDARTPDNPYSLFEGVAGAACFNTDLLKPMESSFPLFDIFFDYTHPKEP